MTREFNTAGPMVASDHYLIPPLSRVDLDGLLELVRRKRYFVLHAPRQTGKTSTLLALRDLLNGGTEYACVYANFEVGQAARENVADALRAVLGQLAGRAYRTLGDRTLTEILPAAFEQAGPNGALTEALAQWAAAAPKPLVLFIDEIDSLIGDALLAVLRQLRAGYDERPTGFPHSVILCGVRDVRDYRVHSGSANEMVLGGSAFNIRSESLRLGDFSEEETRALLGQHTAETGQAFTPEALETIWTRTAGQPWLVNGLCYDACFRRKAGRDRSRPITANDVAESQERLILDRVTHLDDLAKKLNEDRVRRVIEPILAGAGVRAWSDEDLAYVRDLGLVKLEADGSPHIANPIYREVVPRELTWAVQTGLPQKTAWFVDEAGGLDVDGLIAAFQTFFREHSESWVQRFERYHEAGPQLLLQAHLQRVVNGGGLVDREYALGSGRTDLLLRWPQGGRERRFVVECKLLHKGLEPTIAEGLAQTHRYMDRCGAESGHLIVFDRSPERTWDEKIFRRDPAAGGAPITVWGM
ncbi:MAG: AAA family ATPase [Acidobacteria bacterium]|nr:AAA family ATPase [Acidobacteriota bacterium]